MRTPTPQNIVLAYPLRRRDAVLAKGAALAAQVVLISGAAGLALLVLDPVVGLDLALGRILEAVAGLVVLGLLHGWFALGIGAAVANRALAIAVPAGIAVAAYLIHLVNEWLGKPMGLDMRGGSRKSTTA